MNETKWFKRAFALLVLIHVGLQAFAAQRNSFVWTEVANVPIGIIQWQQGRYDLFRSSPPLCRMQATLPATLIATELPIAPTVEDPRRRVEFVLGHLYLKDNGKRSLYVLFVSRLSTLVWSVLGMWTCWRWAFELWGSVTATVVAILWCFSPSILGHGHLVTGDVPSMSVGIFTVFLIRSLLREPGFTKACGVGIAIGVSVLAKPTWLVFWLVALAGFVLYRICIAVRDLRSPESRQSRWSLLFTILLTAVLTINAGYEFTGVGKRLGSFRFFSRELSGESNSQVLSDSRWKGGNRFRGTVLEELPVPLPKFFIEGIDVQKWDFERSRDSYLRGQWRDRGWYYYYLYAFIVKEPLTLVVMLALSLFFIVRDRILPCREATLIVLPAVFFILFLATQTGLSKHYRYFFPALPFLLLIAVSGVNRLVFQSRSGRKLITALVVWYVLASLWVYPHSLSYFNELVGGPHNGHNSLLSSNVAWGQDLSYLARWQQASPERRDLIVRSGVRIVPFEVFGLIDITETQNLEKQSARYLAVSVEQLHQGDRSLDELLDKPPFSHAGYSFRIYQLQN